MRCKIQGVFIGFVENSFKNDKGEEIKYRKIAVNSGELSNDEISVPADVSVAGLRPFQPCYLVLNMRLDTKYKTYKPRLESCTS